METLPLESKNLSTNTSKKTVSTNPYRDLVIEEVAQHVEKLKCFGQDTIDSLAIYIREMK